MEDIPGYAIARLQLQPGDILVLKYKRPLSVSTARKILEVIEPIVEPNKVMLVDCNTDLSVIVQTPIGKVTA